MIICQNCLFFQLVYLSWIILDKDLSRSTPFLTGYGSIQVLRQNIFLEFLTVSSYQCTPESNKSPPKLFYSY